jgi:hypothetical protein
MSAALNHSATPQSISGLPSRNGNYIYETKLDLDMVQLRKLVDEDVGQNTYHAHHRLVKNSQYLSSIKDRLPFLSPVYNIYYFEAGRVVPTHIDGNRYCTLNIPVYNAEQSHTIFYETPESDNLEYDDKRILYYVKTPVKELFRFTLTKPTLVNTTHPHGVINNGDQTRVIISWSVLKPMTFEECCVLCQ